MDNTHTNTITDANPHTHTHTHWHSYIRAHINNHISLTIRNCHAAKHTGMHTAQIQTHRKTPGAAREWIISKRNAMETFGIWQFKNRALLVEKREKKHQQQQQQRKLRVRNSARENERNEWLRRTGERTNDWNTRRATEWEQETGWTGYMKNGNNKNNYHEKQRLRWWCSEDLQRLIRYIYSVFFSALFSSHCMLSLCVARTRVHVIVSA